MVNALSDWLELKIYRDGKVHEMRFRRGDAVAPLKVTGDAPLRENGQPLTGTSVTFLPSLETFSSIEFDRKTLEHRLRELAFLNSGVTICFKDLRGAEPFEEVMHYEGGVEAFVRHLDKAKTPLIKTPIVVRGKREKVEIDLAAVVERQLPRERALLHQQHPAAGRRHPPGGLPRRADPGDHRLCRELRRGQAREGLASPARTPARA